MFTLKFLAHRRLRSYCAEAEPMLNIGDGLIRFCEIDAGVLLVYIELVL